ncbi:hypothetical protein K490DRAFT_61399 [Saccharata proteae CBS 121410]|uniref:Uncharacterized protein n=1 Tax=Saccharata proteae CBS 121410 TaxID=1314787 RepID=A0A9P4I4G9_9PEZI|nr:hypothetical protein K490DRAFT_61399 [Saccharata proteae CBS 121410]
MVDSLPSKAPEVERWRDEPMQLLPVALYTICDLSDEELVQLQDICEAKCEANARGDCVRPAPRWKFAGENLKAIFNYHVQLAESRQFDPTHFIAALDPSWKTSVLFVTLDDEGDECTTDKYWIKTDEAGMAFVNILIGHSDWWEQKEEHEHPKTTAYLGEHVTATLPLPVRPSWTIGRAKSLDDVPFDMATRLAPMRPPLLQRHTDTIPSVGPAMAD